MFNNDNLNDFVKLSDEEIKRRLANAAAAGNISPEKLKSALSDTERVRQIISKMTPADVERFVRILGRENAEKMAEKLKENN